MNKLFILSLIAVILLIPVASCTKKNTAYPECLASAGNNQQAQLICVLCYNAKRETLPSQEFRDVCGEIDQMLGLKP